jgi:methylmalonyl-CoA mutase
LALNQLLILKNESYLNAVANPAEGAYYIESLTKQFATQALEMFKIIEQEGGFLNQLKSGAIQKKISMQAQKEQQRYDSNEEVLVGIHKQSNLQQFMKSQVELYPFLKQNPRKTLIQPIIEKRIADSIEKQRLDHE